MFKETNIYEVKENVVDLLNHQWGLVTAGNESGYNTMTVSWGALGELWNKDTVTLYIRPQRYTRQFLDENEYFTLSFYPAEYKKALAFCGSKSGRDYDKAKETGLTPVFGEKAPYFEEAKIVIICKKMAVGKFEPEQFLDESIDSEQYPTKDYHFIYYGEIVKVLIK
ncbi:MAG: flavin reductase family protein [Eubacterium sp.]|nr:flavin reductase family protein [Eubacterium sp.]